MIQNIFSYQEIIEHRELIQESTIACKLQKTMQPKIHIPFQAQTSDSSLTVLKAYVVIILILFHVVKIVFHLSWEMSPARV